MGLANLKAAHAACRRPCHFVRIHVPTGRQSTGNFNGTHHALWSEEQWRYTSIATLLIEAIHLVAQWNTSSTRDTWRYELRNGEAP